MKTNLDNGKLFGTKQKDVPATILISPTHIVAVHDNTIKIEKAKLEAEHKKAQGLTITRRSNFFC